MDMHRIMKWAAVCVGLMLAGGCVHPVPKVAVNDDPNVSFASFKTYRWMPEPARLTKGRAEITPEVRTTLMNAVDGILKEKGFVRQDSGPVDMLVGFHYALHEHLDVRSMNAYYLYPPGWAWDYYRYSRDMVSVEPEQPKIVLYDPGTVIIDVGKEVQGEIHLVWRGSANELLPREVKALSPEKEKQWIEKAAAMILANFPPQPKAAPQTASR